MILVRTSLVRVLGVPFGAFLVLVMVDKDIPAQFWVLCYDSLVTRHSDVHIATLVVSGLDQESLVPGYGQSAGKRTAASTAADNNVLIFLYLTVLEGSGRSQHREQ